MSGAVYHAAIKCTQKHFIRPVLFAFYEYGMSDLKDFVKEHLGHAVWEDGVDAYRAWLTAPPGSDVPNHLKLYWWILKFWGQLSQ